MESEANKLLQLQFANGSDSQPRDRFESILFGKDTTERIVSVEPIDTRLRVWRRLPDGLVIHEDDPLSPWILTTEPRSEIAAEPRVLEGEGFRILYTLPSWAAFQDARFKLRDAHVQHFTYASASKLSLMASGKTLFKGMTLDDVVRMQVDIETTSLLSAREEDRILIVAVKDNRGLLTTLTGEEPVILNNLVSLVEQRDPDIIEGHNILGFDIPFLMARASRFGIRLGLGRDGSEIRVGQERNFAIGGITRPFAPAYIFGRHVFDTYLAVQRFDWAKGSLPSYGLKQVARAFGIAVEERQEMDRAALNRIYQDDPERVLEYAKHDVIETGRLAELVAPTEFYQTQMVPESYGVAAVTGTGEKINSILVRAYLSEGQAIPRPQVSKAYLGGYTEVRETGIIDRVVKADVESLYPSLMLANNIRPASDTLDVFLPALREMTRRRLEAKANARSASGKDHHYWDGLQSSFKVFINSFYGYLGAGAFNFNDYEAAGRVTELGRALVVDIAERMEQTGSRIIEIDTDGVYFVPPEDVQGEDAEIEYVSQIGRKMPEGIRLAFDGRYRSMVSLKTKNYVLYGYDGKKTFKGASLRSRADEAFGREFLSRAIDLLLEHRIEEIGELYSETIESLLNHKIPIEKLARRERITEKTATSVAKKRSREIAGGTAIGEYISVYERRGGSLGLAEDYVPEDENITYYMDKLYKFAGRLREAFESDFDRYVPKPTAQGLTQRLQASLDLF